MHCADSDERIIFNFEKNQQKWSLHSIFIKHTLYIFASNHLAHRIICSKEQLKFKEK